MSTTNISLPETLKALVDGGGASSEYVWELIRRDQDRLRLRNQLLEGAGSALTTEAGPAYFAELRDRARAPRP